MRGARPLGIVLLTLLGGAFLSGCERIESSLVERAVQRALVPDRDEWLDDGALHVYLCGTGSPLPSRDRAGACTAFLAGGHFFLVDVGLGSNTNLGLHSLPRAALDGVLLTHFHSDHIGELGEVALQSWALGRAKPLPVYGPPGVAEVVAGFEQAYQLDTGYRVAHHGADLMPPAARALVAKTVPVPRDGETALVFEDGDLRVVAFTVDHAPVSPAFGYRIDYGDRSVLVSGDTGLDPNIVKQARGVDLLLHEVLAAHLVAAGRDAAAARGFERRARILGDIIDYHTTPVEAAQVAGEAGVGLLVFTHVVPPPPNAVAERLLMRGVDEAWSGEVVLGQDGMHFRLPRGSDAIEQEQLD